MKPRLKTTAAVGLDFIDEHGSRTFSFQLCQLSARGGLETIADHTSYHDQNGIARVRFRAIDAFEPRRPGIERLARLYMRRSVPQTFVGVVA